MNPSNVQHWVFPNPAKKQEKGEKEKSASPVENVKDEAHLNNHVKDIYMNIKW